MAQSSRRGKRRQKGTGKRGRRLRFPYILSSQEPGVTRARGARGHHFAAPVNRPQACRSTPRWVEKSAYRVSNRPTPGVFVWLRNEAAPVTILDQGAAAPLSICSQTLVGCHRAAHVSAVAVHRYRISPVSGSTHRWFGRWAVSSNTAPVASSIQSSWLVTSPQTGLPPPAKRIS
jgi:hypothetical protein